MIVSIDRYGEFLLSLPGDEIELKHFSIRNVIEEIMQDQGYVFELNEQQFAILLTAPNELAEDKQIELARSITEYIGKYLKENVTIGIGEVVHEPSEIKLSYQLALKSLERKFLFELEQVFIYKKETEMSVSQLDWNDSDLLQSIREGKSERVRKEIELLFGPLDQHAVELNQLRFFMMTTIIHLAKLTEEYHGDWQTFYTGKFTELEHIMRYGVIQSLKQLLLEISLKICSYVEQAKSRKSDSRIQEVVEHIQDHYMDDLNLKELSKLFYINAVYLGQLFKKETGAYFNDYMNKVRITHARTLLEQTQYSTAEISERVGYKYVDHFYRHFKQIYGLNPGELRKMK